MATFSLPRPKLTTTNTLSGTIESRAVIISGNKFLLPLNIDSVVIPDVALTGLTWLTSSPTINGASGAFNNVRLGDVFQGQGGANTDVNTGVYVIAKTNTTLTLSGNTKTASSTYGSTATATAKPGTMDATIAILEVDTTIAGTNVNITTKMYLFDGSKVFDADKDGYDGALFTDAARSITFPVQTIDLDAFLASARVPRS